jgi:glycosyltransferase involved in cell wall biosynthesis
VVIGDGPEAARIRSKQAPNIRILGEQPLPVLLSHLQRARAFVFAAVEDFGIAPLEAQACGTPVIALGKGGAVETIRGLDSRGPTGVFFWEQTIEALHSAVAQFEQESSRIDPAACRANALRFTTERFLLEFQTFVRERYTEFRHEVGVLGD